MDKELIQRLEQAGIRASAQRLAIADYVLRTQDHPSADEVWSHVKARLPMVSRATVYNTLRLFVAQGLLREQILAAGSTVYDPNLAPHHHFIDDASGAIHDVPWDAVRVSRVEDLAEFQVREYSVVLRGRKAGRRR